MNKTIRIVLYVLSILTVAGGNFNRRPGKTGVCAGGDGRRGAGGYV